MAIQYIQPAKTDDFYRRAANAINELAQRKRVVTTKTATFSIDAKVEDSDILLVNATAGAVTVNLPAAEPYKGVAFTVKKTDASANAVTLDGSGAETIDGAATKALATQYKAFTVLSDGTGWQIIAAV